MIDCLTEPALDARRTSVTTNVVLWFRPHRGHPWEMVAAVATDHDAWPLVGTGERKNGDWQILPHGTEP